MLFVLLIKIYDASVSSVMSSLGKGEDQCPGSVGVAQPAWSICTSRYPAGNGSPLADDYLGFCRG